MWNLIVVELVACLDIRWQGWEGIGCVRKLFGVTRKTEEFLLQSFILKVMSK